MPFGWNWGHTCKVFTIPIFVIMVLVLEEVSLIHQKDSSKPTLLRMSFTKNTSTDSQIAPRGNNLVYWTPHKTGSTSMRWWLTMVIDQLGTKGKGGGFTYPYSEFMDHERRLKFLSRNISCTFVMGHIRVPPFGERFDERQLGAVITTTRRSFSTLASKYFHRTAENLSAQTFDSYTLTKSPQSRHWFFYWHDSNPCEPLRYYDGLDDCVLNDVDISSRVQRIVERIDCVVDMDDPPDDLEAICQQMLISQGNCPKFPEKNAKKRRSLYDDLYELPHIRQILSKNLHVTSILRRHMMMKRCRFLKAGNLSLPGYPQPRWPSTRCK